MTSRGAEGHRARGLAPRRTGRVAPGSCTRELLRLFLSVACLTALWLIALLIAEA